MNTVERKTKETDIKVTLELYPKTPEAKIDTGIGFFDHMLTALAVHGGMSLEVSCKGDLEVDGHHTVEDVGIVLGKALCAELGDKSGIKRFASAYIPMDEALSFCAIDISGRPFLVFDAKFDTEKCGDYENCLTEEFFRAFAFNAGITLHLKSVYGNNDHHKAEAMFKACAYALRQAAEKNASGEAVSTKGVL